MSPRIALAFSALAFAGPLMAAPADLDAGFSVGSGAASAVRAVIEDGRGGYIAAGGFTAFQGSPAGRIVRLQADGSRDPDFATGIGANGEIKALELLPGGRIAVVGQFTEFHGVPAMGVAVLKSDGSLDTGFTSRFGSTGFSTGVTCLASLPNGNLMIGGYFTRYAGRDVGRYVAVTSTGAIASAWAATAGADSHVFDIDVLPDGKVLICGFFDRVDGHVSACVARLLADGRVDTSFGTGSNLGTVAYSVEGQADGRVVIGGSFSNYFGLGHRYLGRLSPNGAVETDFASTAAPDLNVYGVKLDPQGRLIVSGQFKKLGGVPARGLGRLLPGGEIDSTFVPAGMVSASFFQEYPIDASGRILAYGWSLFPGLTDQPSVVRLRGGDAGPADSWRMLHFGTPAATGIAAWDATPANDGVTNLEKYALGYQGDPRDPLKLFGDLITDFQPGPSGAGLRYRIDPSRTDVTVQAQWSADLKDWTSDGLTVTRTSAASAATEWQVTLEQEEPSAFFRMKITPVNP